MAGNSQFALLGTGRFAPLFVTQFLGAFHDNLFKNALVVILLYEAALRGRDAPILTTLAAGIFIVPFILFSATGGMLADKIPKDKVIRIIKLAEIGIAFLGALSLMSGSLVLSFTTLFALGTHSAFFGPSKYSILPQHVRPYELIGGNAVLNTGTFLAILAGTVAGTGLIGLPGGHGIVSCLLIAVACLGYAASRFIPPAPPVADGALNLNPVTETVAIIRYTLDRPDGVTRAVFGIGWFYFMGGMFMAQMPNFVHDVLKADQNVLSFLLVSFSIGIAVGGLFNNALLRGRIRATLVPYAMFGITVFTLDLYMASHHLPMRAHLQSLAAFFNGAGHWRILFDLVMISLCGGLFVVPLDAIIQHRTPEGHRARLMAGNAIIRSAFVALASFISAEMIALGFDVARIFCFFAIANGFATLWFFIRKERPYESSL